MNQNHFNTSLMKKMLQSLGLSEGGFEEKISSLTPDENKIRKSILLSMAKGDSVNINDLDHPAGVNIQRLTELDLIHWDQGTGFVTVAYPFSGVPTPHRVTLKGMSPAYSMCAVDALGIPSMFQSDALIESICASCGEKITINVKNNEFVAEPETVVVGLGTMTNMDENVCCNSCEPREKTPISTSCCPAIQFYCSEEHWYESHKKDCTKTKEKLTLKDAFEFGRVEFGNGLNG